MAKSKKTLCKWTKKDIAEDWAEFTGLVRVPRFVCKKCGRAAASKKDLCKPRAIG